MTHRIAVLLVVYCALFGFAVWKAAGDTAAPVPGERQGIDFPVIVD